MFVAYNISAVRNYVNNPDCWIVMTSYVCMYIGPIKPPCFMVLEVTLGLYSTLGDRLTYKRDPFPSYSTILLSSVHKIFLHLLTGQSRCCFAASIRFWNFSWATSFKIIFSQSITNCFNTCFHLKLLFLAL